VTEEERARYILRTMLYILFFCCKSSTLEIYFNENVNIS